MISLNTTGIPFKIHTNRAEMFIGNKQYPSTQTDWKNEIWPPRSSVLTVMITDPTLIRQNTILNTKLAVSSVDPYELDRLRVRDSSMQSSNGPHKSQSRSSLAFSSLTLGIITYFNLNAIRFKSRRMVALTGSSSVLGYSGADCILFTGPDDSASLLSCSRI
jgi:hypothetical protein